MLVLAVDPGIARTGYGVVESQVDRIVYLDYGIISTPPDMEPAQRLNRIFRRITELIELNKPSEVVVEKLFFNANVDTAMSVGQAKGVIMLAAALRNIRVYEYTPLQVKQAVVGYGRAEKKQIQQMVRMLLNLPEVPKPDDAADALALAICHTNSKRMSSLTAPHGEAKKRSE